MTCSRCNTRGGNPECQVCTEIKPMKPETITTDNLIAVTNRLLTRAGQLFQLHVDALRGDVTPDMAASQANAILSKIEDIAREAQES